MRHLRQRCNTRDGLAPSNSKHPHSMEYRRGAAGMQKLGIPDIGVALSPQNLARTVRRPTRYSELPWERDRGGHGTNNTSWEMEGTMNTTINRVESNFSMLWKSYCDRYPGGYFKSPVPHSMASATRGRALSYRGHILDLESDRESILPAVILPQSMG